MILSSKQALYSRNLNSVQSKIANACKLSGRPTAEVSLLAASKRQPIEAIKGLQALGLTEFGESYAAEGAKKLQILADEALIWHFIGPVQSNKTRLIAENFDWIQSIDRSRIAERLNRQRPENMGRLQALIQVNIDSEPQKSGILPEQLEPLADLVAGLPALCLRGLMAIPRADKTEAAQRQSFAAMKKLFDKLQARHDSVDTLSMGMSDDLHSAVMEGSTMVRIGTALFGPREDL